MSPVHRCSVTGGVLTDRQLCMLQILGLMNLENSKLSRKLLELLSNIFYSMPYEHRHDVDRLAIHLELCHRQVSAICRAETMKTIAGSPVLVAKLKKILDAITELMPKEIVRTQ